MADSPHHTDSPHHADPSHHAGLPTHSNQPIERIRLIALVVLALALRGGVCYWNSEQFQQDPDAYRAIAQTLSETGIYGITDSQGQGKPTAFRPPLYPFILSWMVKDGELSRWMVAAFHTLLGALTVLLTVLTSQSLIGNDDDTHYGWPSIAAGLLVAIDPILLQQSTLVMTETIATALATLVIWCWVRTVVTNRTTRLWSWLVIGVFLSLAYLCRPTFLVWAGMLTFAALLVKLRSKRAVRLQTRLCRCAVVGLCVATALACWTVRNQHHFGHRICATSHGGYTLLLANNASFYDYLRIGSWGEAWDAQPFLNAYQHRYEGDPNDEAFWDQAWPEPPKETTDFTEYDDDRRCYLAARATIDREPRMFFWSCMVRAARLWSPVPHHTPDRSWTKIAIVGIYYLAIYAAILAGLWQMGRRILAPAWWPILALAFTLSGVHALYWSNLRMRAPIIPAMSILAAAAIPAKTNRGPEDNVGIPE